MLKKEWCAESNGKLQHLSIPSKTAACVPELAVEDLPLSRTAALVSEFIVKDLPLGRTLWWWLLIYHRHHYHSILPKGRSFTVNSETKAAVLLKGKSSTANSGTQAAVLLGMDKSGSFPLLSAPHSLFRIWTDLKRSEKIPGGLDYIPS